MTDVTHLSAHERLAGAASAGACWSRVQDLFRQEGVSWLTAGTAPRHRLDAVTVQTTLPVPVMTDYIRERLFEGDPWLTHSAVSNAPDSMDFEQAGHGMVGRRCRRLQAVFADHGLRRVCLMPTFGGSRPGALVLYAADRAEADALRDPARLARLRTLAATVAAYWRPEDMVDRLSPDRAGSYLFNPILTLRETEALSWLAVGLQTAEIAHRMGIEAVTVTKHMRTARHKLGARTREHALAIAIRDRLISP